MLTLGIETSCDETAVALVENGSVLSSEVSSSVHLHSVYGGVIPEIASRYHTEYIYPVFGKALEDAERNANDVGLVAVTQGPGLPGSLLVGMSFAKALSFSLGVPLIGVDHLRAHIMACFLGRECNGFLEKFFPFLGTVISGGHTSIYDCKGLRDFNILGRTKDDAVGEAFDKVAKVLGLPYPGGPVVEKRAVSFSGINRIRFPRALLKDENDLDFSFSGIKTAVMYHWRSAEKSEEEKDRICSAFQEAVIDVIEEKLARALRLTGMNRLAVGGGVVNNKALRNRLVTLCQKKGVELYLPAVEYCGDNAAMIAAYGEALFGIGEVSDISMKCVPSGRF